MKTKENLDRDIVQEKNCRHVHHGMESKCIKNFFFKKGLCPTSHQTLAVYIQKGN